MNKTSIICTGASLKGFDLSSIEGHKIVVNYAYKYIDYDMLVAYDDPKHEKLNFPVEKLHTLENYNIGTGYKEGYPKKLDRREGHVMQLNSSLFMAINIAFNAGFNYIDVYGADMKLIDGYVHFYDTEPADEKLVKHYERRFKKNLIELDWIRRSMKSYETLNFVNNDVVEPFIR